MKVSEVAKLTGVTVRTLHYYDEIGLLKPSKVTEAGYRLYSNADLEILQQILFFRELDFSLSDIREIMLNPTYSRETALQNHRELLLQKRKHIDGLISLVDKTLKGDNDMSFKQFDTTEIKNARKEYAAEAKQRWGKSDAYTEYEEKVSAYDDPQWKLLNGEGSYILREFGENRHLDPASKEAQALGKSGRNSSRPTFITAQRQSSPAWVRCILAMTVSHRTSTDMGRVLLCSWRRLLKSSARSDLPINAI